jgi:glucokinase
MRESVVLAFDMGGTDLKCARVSKDGDVRGFKSVPSRALEGEAGIFAAVRAALAAIGGPLGPAVAGFGCPGITVPETGVLVDARPNVQLPLDFPMRAKLEALTGLRVALDNDANMAALAEHRVGAGRGARVSITVTVGTGIGAGIVVNDMLVRGAHGGAGELGHMPVGLEGPACGCGVPGCGEPLAGGAGLAAQARAAGIEAPGAREVFASQHPKAAYLRERMVDALARQLGCAVQLLDPDVIIIGGGVSQAGEALLSPLRRALDRYVLTANRRHLRVVPAQLGERAGVIGAGLAAWDLLAAPRL